MKTVHSNFEQEPTIMFNVCFNWKERPSERGTFGWDLAGVGLLLVTNVGGASFGEQHTKHWCGNWHLFAAGWFQSPLGMNIPHD